MPAPVATIIGSPLLSSPEPPTGAYYPLDEALELLAVLEDVREDLAGGHSMTLLMLVEVEVALLHRKLGLDEGGSDGD